MHKLLIVSPNFPPKSTADIHRIRTSLGYYREFGWDPAVLCVDPSSCEGIDDPLLAESLPKDVKIVSVPAWDLAACRRFGFGQLDLRALYNLYRAGCEMLARERFDVVFFSTTAFLTFVLGPLWKRRFGCKIVYDFQDPWYQGPDAPYSADNAPGGWRKYRIIQSLAKFCEPFALRSADHIIAVSKGYVSMLRDRYAWLQASKFTVIPFGAEEKDYAFVRGRNIAAPLFSPDAHLIRWVYAGRGGSDMEPALRALFRQVSDLRQSDPALVARLRLYFVGTNYAPRGQTLKLVHPIAEQCGVGDLVEEHPERIPYFETLALYSQCDAVLLIGSVSPDYTASKLFNCVLSRRPVLALLNAHSLLSQIASSFPSVFVANFDSDMLESGFIARLSEGLRWTLSRPIPRDDEINSQIKPWVARELTAVQCRIFDGIAGVETAGTSQ